MVIYVRRGEPHIVAINGINWKCVKIENVLKVETMDNQSNISGSLGYNVAVSSNSNKQESISYISKGKGEILRPQNRCRVDCIRNHMYKL